MAKIYNIELYISGYKVTSGASSTTKISFLYIVSHLYFTYKGKYLWGPPLGFWNFKDVFGMRMADFEGVYLVTFIQILSPSALIMQVTIKWVSCVHQVGLLCLPNVFSHAALCLWPSALCLGLIIHVSIWNKGHLSTGHCLAYSIHTHPCSCHTY